MADECFQLVWVTSARGLRLPPSSPQAAFHNHPDEFIQLFQAMALVLNVGLGDLAGSIHFLPTSSPSRRSPKHSSVSPDPEMEQLEMFGPWDVNR